jgi:hypothetical protein
MSKVYVTRYLYKLNDVKNSLLISLLEKKNIKKVYFWLSEYYYSGFYKETWNYIMKIYYDFYSYDNYRLNKIIIKKYKEWLRDNNFNHLLEITKNIFYKKFSYHIFLANYNKINNIKINKKKTGNFSDKYIINNKQDLLFIISLHSKNINHLIYYIKNITFSLDTVINNLNVFTNKKFQDNIYYKNKKHLLLVHLFQFIHKKTSNIYLKYIKISDKETKFINRLNLPITPSYKTLKYNRLFKISIYTNCFDKFNIPNITNEELLWYHWLYYAYDTPLWNKRFKQFNAIKCEKTKDVIFKTDDDNEKFHELYGYEPDEQSYEVQNKSVNDFDNLNISHFIEDFFQYNINNLKN